MRKRRAPRRQGRKKDVQLAFEALSIEGGLLSPDWLTNIAQLKAEGQKEPDYRVPKGLNLRDEIGRYWRMAQAGWKDFEAALNAAKTGADPRAATERWVLSILRDSFGFTSLQATSPVELDSRTYPIGHSALGRRVPVVITSPSVGIDTPIVNFGEDGKRRSAFGLAQEFLNADANSMWGIATDGVFLRVLRDNASLTRPAWIEVDLQRIFTEERYADFAAFWLICHETRFGREDRPPTESPLETWRNAGLQEGTRAREFLRQGVEEALMALGQGFLVHPDNQGLRAQLQNGQLTTRDYFNQLLRMVYRLIFLLTVEERNLLHPEGTIEAVRKLYAQGYSLRRLREASAKRSAHDRFSDQWEAVKIVFRGLSTGEPRLGIPALAGIFAKSQCPALDSARLTNSDLLLAVLKLAWIRDESGLARVNWRDMGPEELGSVYESLLELVPQVSNEGRTFSFATGGETKGNARKTTGSYYTPDSLVQVLLDSTLEPVVTDTIARSPERSVEALLNLSIVDPASGSGHFLLAAARRLAGHVARLQAGGTPSATEYRHALRLVVGRCIYGVDVNPMAVELCKVSLWMEAVEPGLPLTFLDSHIQHGNALIGTTRELMAGGVPDDAWQPIEGDDRKVVSAHKKRNKAESEGGQRAFALTAEKAAEAGPSLNELAVALDRAPDTDLASLEKKAEDWKAFFKSGDYQRQRFAADTWCAAFVWPKEPGAYNEAAPTNGLWRQVRDGQSVPPTLARLSTELADEYSFFHWHLAFPQVFARGGFDLVLGNPPWERVKLQEQEFFASRSEEIANAPSAAARKRLIAMLPNGSPQLWAAWCEASRKAEGESHFIRRSGRYPLCGKGDINTYAIFAEHNRSVLRTDGRAGFIVPTGIATDDTTKDFFGILAENGTLSSLYDFENSLPLFPGVHRSFKLSLLTLSSTPLEKPADLVFYLKDPATLTDQTRHFSLSSRDFETLNPNTRTCPTFRSRRDADINLDMYRRSGIFIRESDEEHGNPWQVKVKTRLWHMTEDAEWFRTQEQLLQDDWNLVDSSFVRNTDKHVPLLEGKMIYHFDHRFGSYDGGADNNLSEVNDVSHANPDRLALPFYWVPGAEASARLSGVWSRGWLLGWRDITNASNERTVISALIPTVAVGNSCPLLFPACEPSMVACLYANLCSFSLDYAARQKVGGTHLNFLQLKQLPILPPSTYLKEAAWQAGTTIRDWILPRVVELVYTARDIEPFARDVGYDGPPFRWDPFRRFQLRCELDAAFFHLYGLSRDDAGHILDAFPIVRKKEEKAYGAFRTKQRIFELFDQMAKKT
jgi:hypothetical protein